MPDFAPASLGEHIKKKRLELGLSQRQVATHLRVNPFTVANWEKGYCKPRIAVLPAVLEFLGYDPEPVTKPQSFPERLSAARRQRGWSKKRAARELGIDEGTLASWERGDTVPWRKYQPRLAALFAK